jgi:hypothetical protein
MPPQPAGRAAAVANVDAVRGRFPEASRDRRLVRTIENPVLIAVLATAFIGERTSWASPGRPGIIGVTEPAASRMAPAGGASTKASIPRKRTWWVGAAVGIGDHRVGFAGWFVMQSGGDEAPMVGDDVVSASIT